MAQPTTKSWDSFVEWAKRFWAREDFDEKERDYKLVFAGMLREVRVAADAGPQLRREQLESVFKHKDGKAVQNIVRWQDYSRYLEWAERSEAEFALGLSGVWQDGASAEERIRAFLGPLPADVVKSPSSRLTLASFLLLGVDAKRWPPYRYAAFKKTLELTATVSRLKTGDEAETYRNALDLLDRLLEESRRRGLELRDRLDAQGLVWAVTQWWPPNPEWSPADRVAFSEFIGRPLFPKKSRARKTPTPKPVAGDAVFTPRTFELLADLSKTPTRDFYAEHKEDFVSHVERPLQDLLTEVAQALPEPMLSVLETEKQLFSRINKNDYGGGGAWDFYWGAFYPKGGKRIRDAQLFVWINHDRLEAGFAFGAYGSDAQMRYMQNLAAHRPKLRTLLAPDLDHPGHLFGDLDKLWDDAQGRLKDDLPSFGDWLDDPETHGLQVRRSWSREGAVATPRKALVEEVAGFFVQLFPLFLLSTASEDPLAEIAAFLEGDEPPVVEVQPELPLSAVADKTGFDVATLERWVRALRRKGQAILYGPPGTGKTFAAELLAEHLIGGGTGFKDLVQFHPAYAYEDFIQGIRPRTRGGQVTYELMDGRFVDFCRRAEAAGGVCVLIIDEINRANLSRVFGELMYLLEYRDREVPLAGGKVLRIPGKVLVLGTMNTADRSIALVDHALRRRFAFLHLRPNYEALERYHEREKTGFDPSGLIEQLKLVNQQINDPHYEVGISFFLRPEIGEDIEDVWRMEIVPYLEEYFFDQQAKVATFEWEKVRGRIVGG